MLIEPGVISDLKSVLGPDNVITHSSELFAYSYDGQPINAIPDAMVMASNVQEVAEIVRFAGSHHIPLVARGAGSGMTGGSVPEKGGIVLNLELMNRIIHINEEDLIGYVQPGVITGEFQKEAAGRGLFYPPEPASSAFSTIGGNVAESAGGLGCVKYGLTKQFVEGLEFVTARGNIVRTGVYTDKDSPFDAGAILAGSEGTLAIITEIAIRLIPLPESRITVLALFRTLVDAAHASNSVLSSGVGPAVLEFMDGKCIDTVREYADVEIPEGTGALLIVELDGDGDYISAGHELLLDVLKRSDPISVKSARNDEERKELWKLRKSLSPSIGKIAPLKFNEDICVPISKIPDICAFIEDLGSKRDVMVVSFGHSGDGNLHVNFMTHWKKPDEVERVKQGVDDLFREVVRIGGTLSGEHGIGIAKRPFIPIALDEATIEFEKKIKRAFDPDNILNPGKIFPE
ncbi:MAG: FAD-binding protein [Candidatus Latescibacteria bacterium]|nr:FAD-binding protein [Candidatus Latescibacterota bacterium]